MPLYDYYCINCDYTTESVRPIEKRDENAVCGSCGIRQAERRMSAPAVVKIQGGGTRNMNQIKMVPLETRLRSQYGDNP